MTEEIHSAGYAILDKPLNEPTTHCSSFPYMKYTRNSSGDEIANVNFLYDDIVHALKIQ